MTGGMLVRLVLVAIVLSSLAGCVRPVQEASPIQHRTLSGKPEVTFSGPNVKEVGQFITDGMIKIGYTVQATTENTLIFEKIITGPLSKVYMGKTQQYPHGRVIFTLIHTNDATRVIADIRMVTDAGTALEHVADFNNGQDSAEMQVALYRMKEQLERKR